MSSVQASLQWDYIQDQKREMKRLHDELAQAKRERDGARRELQALLESIRIESEQGEPQPLREGEPSDFCGAIRRMRDAEKQRDEAREALKAVRFIAYQPEIVCRAIDAVLEETK